MMCRSISLDERQVWFNFSPLNLSVFDGKSIYLKHGGILTGTISLPLSRLIYRRNCCQIDKETYPNDAGGLVVDLINHNLEKMVDRNWIWSMKFFFPKSENHCVAILIADRSMSERRKVWGKIQFWCAFIS